MSDRNVEIEQEIIALDELWARAPIQGDAATYDSIITDDFIGINAGGALATKQDRLREFDNASAVTFDAIESDERIVRIYGDAAVLTGRTVISGHRHGRPFGGTYRYTHVYPRRNGRWQAVSAHMSSIPRQ